jgi:hypothetical protein
LALTHPFGGIMNQYIFSIASQNAIKTGDLAENHNMIFTSIASNSNKFIVNYGTLAASTMHGAAC